MYPSRPPGTGGGRSRLRRRSRVVAVATAAAAIAAVLSGTANAAPTPGPAAVTQPAAAASPSPAVSRLTAPQATLAPGWRSSADRAVTVSGDENGMNVLVAEASSGYQWRTAATLSEPGFDTAQWIGQSCVTSSGRRAVVVYAPSQFVNDQQLFDQGAFVAVVDLVTGVVRKLPFTASLAYYNPGCGEGEQVALTSLGASNGRTTSTVRVIDAASGKVLRQSVAAGQLSSPVPYGGAVVAALGSRLVSVDAKGAEHALTRESGTPFRLHPDAGGGLAYEVPSSHGKVQVRRLAAGRSTLVGTGDLDAVQLTRSGDQVDLIGADSRGVAARSAMPAGWKQLDAPSDSEVSTTGALAVTSSSNRTTGNGTTGRAPLARGSASQHVAADLHDRITIDATVTTTRKQVSFTVDPAVPDALPGRAPSPALRQFTAAATPRHTSGQHTTGRPAASGAPASGGPASAGPKDTPDPSTVPWDPDRGCAVARNDPSIQTYQATAQQVEWAADLAVQGQLTPARGANWEGSGLTVSWTPQGMFPPQQISGGGSVPAQVLLGVLAQESNTLQASPHAVDAVTGNVNQGGFYGNGGDWSTVDCGYGIGQITTGMAMSTPAGTRVADGNPAYTTAQQQQAVATDYASNIAATMNMLIDKWNQLKAAGIVVNDGDPSRIENWWLAVWAYNSGVQPTSAAYGNTTGCTPGPSCTDGAGNWGLGWANNPANPSYPADRGVFSNDPAKTKVPNHWTYPELVIGWAYSPVARFNYASGQWGPAYAAANGLSQPMVPPTMTFCTSADSCTPNGAADSTGAAGTAGLCNAAGLHCWWHWPVSWGNCATNCGTGNLTYTPSSAKPGGTDIYPADCRALGTAGGSSASDSLGNAPPAGSVVVDDVTTASVASCNQTWTDAGSFGLKFTDAPQCTTCSQPIDYPGKIDFHQLGLGFGGHIWFTHTVAATDTAHTVTGTWTPPALTGWYRIRVHIPDSGDLTKQADYQINPGNGPSQHRIVNTAWEKNTWVDLGAFNLSGQPSVSLSNATADANGADIAWDAVAFSPTTKPTASYVALGDSYSAGEGQDAFDANSDFYGGGPTKDACHRSVAGAYPRMVTLPGQSTPLAQQAGAVSNNVSFAFLACSGDTTVDMTSLSVDSKPTTADQSGNTVWGGAHFGYGEHQELDDGYLNDDTTLVTLSVGGDDARFAKVLQGCIQSLSDCTAPDYYLKVGNSLDPSPLVQYEPYVINTLLPSHLATVYGEIHHQAPNAQIVVVGYPHLFAPTPLDGCAGLSTGQETWMNQLGDDLDNTIASVVQQVASTGVNIGFVDPRAAWDAGGGHWACEAGGTPWVNALVAWSESGSDGGSQQIPGAGSFHPTSAGQAAYAQLVNAYLAG
ncbi:golvesin C-terminal-like domain-containing protein [Streptacidiphilus anmyonensis]|uniref:golvesin C-terminal-like domain-containing protein n=1 Tax=Streptacidiphilus anmyonensis TaxID=405782 RepID=UPI0006949329|nr:hypothetical protein [Streptacidiphilus anmyonensis]